VTFC